MNSAFLKNLAFAAAALVLAALFPASARAADIVAPEDTSDWTFTVAAYAWAASLDGQVAAFEQEPVDVDVSFGDLLENLDFALMGLGEARNGPFLLGVDMTYTSLSADVSVQVDPSDPATKVDIDANSTLWMVTGYGGYTLFDEGAMQLDAIAGARLWSVNTDFETSSAVEGYDNISDDDGATWVDPLAGVKLRLDVTEGVYVAAWGMAGGFGVGSELMWDVMAGAGYAFNDTFDLFAGYRAVSVDYEDDGFVFDVVEQGPVVAGVFHF